ncbi:MAG TPA: gamma-glutamylcyclotransferase [Candidatus Cybelea sp.]|nr:gamma-glutamylcyclotransferase [Candidatus Cybelea sp.]
MAIVDRPAGALNGAGLARTALERHPDGMLRREEFTEERLDRISRVARELLGYRLLSAEERQASLGAVLSAVPRRRGVWIFGYGSLMWNPALKVAETRAATVHGYHRWFCLDMHLGRGSPDRPGLMLGLDRGGSCHGMAHRIAPQDVESELEILWRREMLSGAYQPRWVTAYGKRGALRALTFVVDRRHDRYAGKLPEQEVVMRIALAEGHIGTNRQYLFKTVEHLDQLGIDDGPMHRLARLVRDRTG